MNWFCVFNEFSAAGFGQTPEEAFDNMLLANDSENSEYHDVTAPDCEFYYVGDISPTRFEYKLTEVTG